MGIKFRDPCQAWKSGHTQNKIAGKQCQQEHSKQWKGLLLSELRSGKSNSTC